MPAHEHINQLQMFMTGQDIKNIVNDSYDLRGTQTMDRLWELKERKARNTGGIRAGGSLYDSLNEHGYMEGAPALELQHHNDGTVVLVNGHHRVAAAAALEREGKKQILFPVTHLPPFSASDWDSDWGVDVPVTEKEKELKSRKAKS